MRRVKRILIALGALAAALLVAAYVALSNIDPTAYRSTIEDRLRAATGREVTLGGEMGLAMGLRPALSAQDVTIGNPAWAGAPHFLEAERVAFQLSLPPLLTGRVSLASLVVEAPRVHLQRGPKGATWNMGRGEASDGGGSVPDLGAITLREATLVWHADRTHTVTLPRAELRDGGAGMLDADVVAELRGTRFTLEGRLGTPGPFLRGERTLPLDLTVTGPDAVQLAVRGQLSRTDAGLAPDLRVEASGDGLDGLSDALQTGLPPLGAFQGSGDVGREGGAYTLRDLDLSLGESDLSGKLTVERGDRRLAVNGRLKAATLNLPSLTQRLTRDGKPDGGNAPRLFSDTPLPLDALRAARGEVRVRVGTLRLREHAALNSFEGTLALRDGRLTTGDLSATLAGAPLDAALTLDAAARPPRLDVELDGDNLPYGRLLADAGVTEAVEGTADLDLALTGQGDSPRAWAETAGGDIRVSGRDGRIASALLDSASGSVAEVLAPWRETGEGMALTCTVARLTGEDGAFEVRALLADTPQATLAGSGTLSLGDESYDVRLIPKAKAPSLMSLAVPMRLGGHLTQPQLGPDPAGMAKLGAMALGTALNPLAAAAVVAIDTETNADNPCRAALKRADEAVEEGGNGGDMLDEAGDTLDSFFGQE